LEFNSRQLDSIVKVKGTGLDSDEDIEGRSNVFSFGFPTGDLMIHDNRIKIVASLFSRMIAKSTSERVDNHIGALLSHNFREYFKSRIGAQADTDLFRVYASKLNVSPLVSLAYGIYFYVKSTDVPQKKYTQVNKELTDKKMIRRIRKIATAIGIRFMKEGLLFPFDLYKRSREKKRGRMKTYRYYYASNTINYYMSRWMMFDSVEEGGEEEKKIKKEIEALVNTHTALTKVLYDKLTGGSPVDIEYTKKYSDALKFFDESVRKNVLKLTNNDNVSESNYALALFYGTLKLQNYVRHRFNSKALPDLQLEVTPSSPEPSPVSIVPVPVITPETIPSGVVTTPSANENKLLGETVRFVEQLSIGLKSFGNTHKEAMDKINVETKRYKSNLNQFRAFLQLMNSDRFSKGKIPGKYGGSDRPYLKYKDISDEEIQERLSTFIRENFKGDETIVRIESIKPDGSMTLVTSNGVRIHYDGKKKTKRYSNEFRFEKVVHSPPDKESMGDA